MKKAVTWIIAIIAVLAVGYFAVVFFGFGGPGGLTQERERVDAELLDSQMYLMRLGLESYYLEFGNFPDSLNEFFAADDVVGVYERDFSDSVTFDYTVQQDGEYYELCGGVQAHGEISTESCARSDEPISP